MQCNCTQTFPEEERFTPSKCRIYQALSNQYVLCCDAYLQFSYYLRRAAPRQREEVHAAGRTTGKKAFAAGRTTSKKAFAAGRTTSKKAFAVPQARGLLPHHRQDGFVASNGETIFLPL